MVGIGGTISLKNFRVMVKEMRETTCDPMWKTGIKGTWNGAMECWKVGGLGSLPSLQYSSIPSFLNCGNFDDKKGTTQ